MADDTLSSEHPHQPRSSRLTLWSVVLTAFVLTVWLAGPRAVDVLAARYQQVSEQSPLVDLDRVGFLDQPEWLRGPLLVAVAADLAPALQRKIPILDARAAVELERRLRHSPWLRAVRLERVFPDRFRLALDLRRPVLSVRTADGDALCLSDRDGIALPWVDAPGLPVVRLYQEGGGVTVRCTPGEPVPEPRVVAAARVAVEWRDELRPLVSDCPELVEVDTTNLGERWMRGRSYPEVRVKLRRADGEPVTFGYGRPVGSPLPRVAVQTKAWVLDRILARRKGLDGLVAGDLRFRNRWLDYLQPREPGVADPDGPWGELDRLARPAAGR